MPAPIVEPSAVSPGDVVAAHAELGRVIVQSENEPPPGGTDEPASPAAQLGPAADPPETPVAEDESVTGQPAPVPGPLNPGKSRGPSRTTAKERRWDRFRS